MVMLGLATLVTILVGSVTSTCLRSSLGARRALSGPISPVSSGTLPGQSSMTTGLSFPAAGFSSPTAGEAVHSQAARGTVHANRILFAPLLTEEGRSPARQASGLGKPSWFHLPC